MAKVKIKGLRKASKKFLDVINDAISDNKLYQDSAELLKKEIREGKNPKTGRPYRQLTQSTIDARKRLASTNPTHPSYTATKSNLTLTGKLIDGIFSTFNKSKKTLTISLRGKHPGYKLKKGSRTKPVDRLTIADGLAGQGRPIIQISKRFKDRIIERINKALRKL